MFLLVHLCLDMLPSANVPDHFCVFINVQLHFFPVRPLNSYIIKFNP